MREIKTCPDQKWKQLPTEELDQILQAELRKEYPSEEVVLPILQELEDRERGLLVETPPEVLEILEKLNKHETSSKQSLYRRRWLAGIAAVAAAACIVVMALPRTAGAQSLSDLLFRWTESIFEFFTPEQNASNPPVDITFVTENPGLQQLFDTVNQQGVTEPVVPQWLPEGFELTELVETPISGGTKIHGAFEKNNQFVNLTYWLFADTTAAMEKEGTPLEVYEHADVGHVILENMDNFSVTWTVAGVKCAISASVSKQDVYTIIQSIYRRSLE